MARRPYRTKEGLTLAQREERAYQMQRQANMGWSQWRIARYHGVRQGTVSKILKKNLERNAEPMTADEVRLTILKKREGYRQVIEDAYRSYLRSLKDTEREEWERVQVDDDNFEMMVTKRVREGQAGNSGFLQVILKAMRDDSELLQLVKNVTINNTNQNTQVAGGFQGVLEAPPDAIEERIAAAQELPRREG